MTVKPTMALHTIEPEQHTAAKIVGFVYLFLMAIAIFGEFYARGSLIVPGNAVQTAANIAASERLFRIGALCHLICAIGDVVLLWALYVVLRPINRNVALLAAFLRLVECAVYGATIVNDFAALRVLSGAAYLQVFDTQELQVLARLFISVWGAGFGIVMVFLGLGSAVFSYLWFQSRYVPRLLAGWGIFASLALAIGTMIIMVFPGVAAIGMTYMAPLFLYEVGLGLWLLVKGIRAPIVG